MKELLRLVLIAVLCFVVVGGTMLYSSDSNLFAPVTSFLAGNTTENAQDVNGGETISAANRLWVPRPNQDTWVGLTGFPDTVLLEFALPKSISIEHAQLDLKFDTQLAQGGDGRLSIAVNGKPKGEIVLNDGRERHEALIDLDPQDLFARAVQVEISSVGTTGSGQICPSDTTNAGVAINLTPQSGLAIYTNDPLNTAGLRAVALAEPVLINLGATPESQAAALKLAYDMNHAISTHFVAEPLSANIVPAITGSVPLDLIGNNRLVVAANGGGAKFVEARGPAPRAAPAANHWPVAVATLGTDVLARNFRVIRRWAIDYSLAELPRAHTPRRLDLAVKLSDLTDGEDWSLRVLLNGHLLTSKRLEPTEENISLPVSLPLELQRLRNAISIELVDNSTNDSVCRNGRLVEAQLLPATQLRDLGVQPSEGWGRIVRVLARADTIGLTVAASIDPARATQVAAMLDLILQPSADVVLGEAADAAPAEIQIVTSEVLQNPIASLSQSTPEKPVYLAVPARSSELDPLIVELQTEAAKSAIDDMGEDGAGLLIRLNAP